MTLMMSFCGMDVFLMSWHSMGLDKSATTKKHANRKGLEESLALPLEVERAKGNDEAGSTDMGRVCRVEEVGQ